MVDDNLDESCTVPLLCVGTLQPSRKNFCGPFQAFALNPCHCHCKCCEALTKCVPRCMQLCMDTGHSTWCLCRTFSWFARSAQKRKFDIPYTHTTFGSRSFSVTDPQTWNHLPA